MFYYANKKIVVNNDNNNNNNWGAFIRRGRLKGRNLHKHFLILGGAFIGRRKFIGGSTVIGSTPADKSSLDAEVVVPSKYLSNFWRSLDLPLIYCKIELDL